VKLLTGDRSCLTVVGDDDQSDLFVARGAPGEHESVAAGLPGLKVIKLEQNYRSTNTILTAANALIANNAHVFEKSCGANTARVIRSAC